MKALILGLILSVCATVHAHESTEVGRAWDYACSLGELSCEGITPPNVVTSNHLFNQNPSLWRTFGFFLRGEKNIYVRDLQDRDVYTLVLVHEMYHYVQDAHGIGTKGAPLCSNEEDAFAVEDQVALDLGRPELVTGPEWWKPYENCQNYTEEKS